MMSTSTCTREMKEAAKKVLEDRRGDLQYNINESSKRRKKKYQRGVSSMVLGHAFIPCRARVLMHSAGTLTPFFPIPPLFSSFSPPVPSPSRAPPHNANSVGSCALTLSYTC